MSSKTIIRYIKTPWPAAALLLLAAPALAAAAFEGPASAAPDTALSLQGDEAVSSLGDLTVEGENRIEISFSRPALDVDLDPRDAPGLTWGEPGDVLDRSVPDLVGPYLAESAGRRTPYAPRPWLDSLRTGPVARFRPSLTEVENWQLSVVDSRGDTVVVFTGKKSPPEAIVWDGRDAGGEPCWPGFTYSYVFEAFDRAGNRRSFAGQGFQPAAYRTEDGAEHRLMLTGDLVGDARARSGAAASTTLLEVAGFLNQRTGPREPVYVTAVARDHAQAESLGERVRFALAPLLLGENSRIAVTTRAAAGAPREGAVQVSTVPVAAR